MLTAVDELSTMMDDFLHGYITGREFEARFLAFHESVLVEQDHAMYDHPTLGKQFAALDKWSWIMPRSMWRKRYAALCAQLTNCRVQPLSALDNLIAEVYKAVSIYTGDDDDLKIKMSGFREKLKTQQ